MTTDDQPIDHDDDDDRDASIIPVALDTPSYLAIETNAFLAFCARVDTAPQPNPRLRTTLQTRLPWDKT